MKILKYKITILTLTMLFVSCNEEVNNNQETNSENLVKVVELSLTSSYSGSDLGIYGREFGDLNDFTLRNKVTNHRTVEGLKDHLNSYVISKDNSQINTISSVSFGDLSYEKTASDMMEPKFLSSFRANKGAGIEQKVNQISADIFGKQQSFSFKGNNYVIEENQYIPKKIAINKMGNFDESIKTYKTKRANLSVEYNVDTKNENGVALVLVWDGSRQDMSLQELGSLNMDIKNIIVVHDPKDSGVINVPSTALSKFPKNANVTALLMRGNSSIIEIENKKHYIVTSSEQQERIIIED
jgi:hypothetical protein